VGVGRAPQVQLTTVAATRHRRRRRSALAAAVVLVAAILLGATARSALAAAPYVDGIADQNLGQWNGNFVDGQGVFNEPFYDYFQQAWVGTPPSHILYARFVTAPDVIAQGGSLRAEPLQLVQLRHRDRCT
jgi:opacity protein-like surface antigen